jgi:hypothetical protein
MLNTSVCVAGSVSVAFYPRLIECQKRCRARGGFLAVAGIVVRLELVAPTCTKYPNAKQPYFGKPSQLDA